jgi:hypothetical protein
MLPNPSSAVANQSPLPVAVAGSKLVHPAAKLRRVEPSHSLESVGKGAGRMAAAARVKIQSDRWVRTVSWAFAAHYFACTKYSARRVFLCVWRSFL